MATCATYTKKASVDDVEETSERLKETLKFSEDDSETQITICTWNINGTANAGLRKKVTTATFNQQRYEDGTRLGQSDIICVQEMTNKPGAATDQEYFPFTGDRYGVASCKEPAGKYNAVYYNKEKFSQVAEECLTPAYDLMNIKKRCYDFIQEGGDTRKKNATKGLQVNVPAWINDNDERKIFQEVLSECREAGTLQGFERKISKFQAPGEMETKDPSDLLKRRMAMCVLKIKTLPGLDQGKSILIFAASVHNYSGRSGRESPENYACLLFDFLSKLQCNIDFEFTVIIAGDFNFDILACGDQSLMQYFPSCQIPRYKLRPLREGLSTIDFIVVTKPKPNAQLQVSVSEVQAHDLQVDREVDDKIEGDHRKITNHSPVSAVIEIKLKK